MVWGFHREFGTLLIRCIINTQRCATSGNHVFIIEFVTLSVSPGLVV
jgi:hypothetical protein